jgi:hypothetical protein
MRPALLILSFPPLFAQDPAAAAPAAVTVPAAADAPPRIEWQRTLADALAVQQATGRPLLICVNQDGEVFCDRFASETYVDPGFVAATRGWVCVIASPDRHNESDYDGLGRRIECPRFGGCTCSEHIDIEPRLYERWFQGQRTAPRHIGVDQDGKVLFDRFLDRSMDDAIDAVKQHAADAGSTDLPAAAADLLQRRDARARVALELRYRDADAGGRRALLTAAAAATTEPFDLLRMGLREDDPAVFVAAARALARTATAAAGIDLQDALARCDDAELAKEIVAAVDRVAAGDQATRQFAAHWRAAQDGIARAAHEPFATAMRAPAAAAEPTVDRDVLEGSLDAAERRARAAPADPAAQLAVALANLDLARHLAADGGSLVPMFYEDARRAAERAAKTMTDNLRAPAAHAVIAVARWQQGEAGEARFHATEALTAAEALGTECDVTSPLFAALLGVAARAAAADAYATVEKERTAVAADDVRTAAFAFTVLAQHPSAGDDDQRQAAALLAFAGARREAQAVLARGIARSPASRDLHNDYRLRIIADRGAEALRARYAAFVRDAADRATAEWFAGYAAIVAAELHVKDRRAQPAASAYGECIDRLRRSAELNADFADSANHFVVLALAGRALLRHLAGDGDGAVADLLAAAELRPASMTESDGLGRRPDAILRRVARELREQGKAELAEKLPGGQ